MQRITFFDAIIIYRLIHRILRVLERAVFHISTLEEWS